MQPVSPVATEELKVDEVIYAKDQAEYNPLAVLRSKSGRVISRWTFTDEERAAIAGGADLFLCNWTFNQPLQPVLLMVRDSDTEKCLRQVAEILAA